MFTRASFRLAAWYVAILMTLSIAFSAWLYVQATGEVRNGLNAQLLRPYSNLLPRDEIQSYLTDKYHDSQARIIGSLALLNIGVFIAGSVASYLLARRTLRPIEAALEAQNRFTADASHELRTPLTTMKTEIEVALRDTALPASEARELLASNVEEIDRLSQLVDGLLILARTGDKPMRRKVDLDPLVQKTCKRFAGLAHNKQIAINVQTTHVAAIANPSHVDTIVGVLLDNALKYSPKKSTVSVALAVYDGAACVTVHNEGPGISAYDLPHIFERFYRADTSRTGGHTSGHGLGLSIAQKLATNMNGTIAVASNKKTGTTFTLRLEVA